jgi:hypothetical protein
VKLISRIPIGMIGIIAVAGLLALALAVFALLVDAPYRPERYVGGIDPLRAGLAGFLAAGVALFALFALAGLAGWRLSTDGKGLAAVVVWAGMAVAVAALLVMVVSMPPVRTFAVPTEIRIPLFVGLAMAVAGLIPSMYSGAAAAVRRRDLGLLAAVVVIAVLVAIDIVARH